MRAHFNHKLFAIALILYPLFLSLLIINGSGAATIVEDDFASDSGNWTYLGDAKRANGCLVVAPNDANKVGAVYYKEDVNYPFEITFTIKVQADAEGLSLNVFHNREYVPAGGAALGASYSATEGDGWDVEFDTNNNGGYDLTGDHIALNGADDNWHWKKDTTKVFNDGKSHTVTFRADEDESMILTIDGTQIFDTGGDWNLDVNNYLGIGFSAATGPSGGTFQVDNVKITDPYGTDTSMIIIYVVIGVVGLIVLVVVIKKVGGKNAAVVAPPNLAALGPVDPKQYPMNLKLEGQISKAAQSSPDPQIQGLFQQYNKANRPTLITNLVAVVFITISNFTTYFLLIPGIAILLIGICLFMRSRPVSKQLIVYMGLMLGMLKPAGSSPAGQWQQPAPVMTPATTMSPTVQTTMPSTAQGQNVKYCQKCGKPCDMALKFCSGCGNPFS